jgi:hypothetical protein
VNFIGNYVKSGPNTRINTFVRDEGAAGYYLEDNVVEGSIRNFFRREDKLFTRRFNAPSVATTSAQTAYDQVLKGSGASHGLNCDGSWFPRRDTVDIRIVQSVIDTSSGHDIPPEQTFQQLGYISNPSDVGGWPVLDPGSPCLDIDHDGMPDIWEIIHFGDSSRGSATDSSSDLDMDGYTDLEEYLNGTDPKVIDIGFSAPSGPTPEPSPTPQPSPTASPTSTPQPTSAISPTPTSAGPLPSLSAPAAPTPEEIASNASNQTCPDCQPASPRLSAVRYCDAAGNPVSDAEPGNPRLYIGIGCIPISAFLDQVEVILPWFMGIGGGVLLILLVYVGSLMKSLRS